MSLKDVLGAGAENRWKGKGVAARMDTHEEIVCDAGLPAPPTEKQTINWAYQPFARPSPCSDEGALLVQNEQQVEIKHPIRRGPEG